MQPDYFKPYIQSGIALVNMGRKAEAEPFLKKSNELLPNAPAHLYLGELAEERGEMDVALTIYEAAASSNSDIGKVATVATARYMHLDLPRNPANYLRAAPQVDARGQLYAVVQNPTSVQVSRVQVHVVQYDSNTGRAVGQS